TRVDRVRVPEDPAPHGRVAVRDALPRDLDVVGALAHERERAAVRPHRVDRFGRDPSPTEALAAPDQIEVAAIRARGDTAVEAELDAVEAEHGTIAPLGTGDDAVAAARRRARAERARPLEQRGLTRHAVGNAVACRDRLARRALSVREAHAVDRAHEVAAA